MRSAYGSITRLSKDRYRVRYLADLGDGRGRVRHSVTVRGSRRDARRRLSELEAEHGTDTPTMTLAQCAERFWLPDCEDRIRQGDMRESTLDVYRSAYRTHVAPRWGSTMVTGIRPLDLQEWLLTLPRLTGKRCLYVMRAILRLAVLYEAAPSNVAEGRYRLSGEESPRPKTIWSASEVVAMCDAVRGTALEVPVVMCGIAGCRTGEGLGLMASDCERVGGAMCCHVHGELTLRGYQPHVKNPQSDRWAVVPEPWASRLDALLADGREWLNSDGVGGAVRRRAVRDGWERAFRDGGCLSGFRHGELSGLRNSWRTYMRDELRVDRDVLEKMMGHRGRGVGEQHYYRPDREAFAEVASEAWRRWFEARK